MKSSVHEAYAHASGGEGHWWIRARRDIFGRLLGRWVRPSAVGSSQPSAEVLDLGPGHGVNLDVLARHGRVTVLDMDFGSLESSIARGAANAVRGDATRLPFADRSFDLVVALDVIEHLDEDDSALRECRRVLRPGGGLLVTVPALRILWGRQDVASDHRRRYSRRRLRDSVTAAGFRIQRLSYFNTLLFPPILCVRILMRPFLRWSKAGHRSDFSVPAPFGLNKLLWWIFRMEGAWLPRADLPIGVSLLCWAVPESDNHSMA